jgi:hypothetical protein
MTKVKKNIAKAVTEKELYKNIDKIIKNYLTKKTYNELALHEVTETLACITALYLALYSSLFVEKSPTSHIDYIANKIDELAVESYIDDFKLGLKFKKKK